MERAVAVVGEGVAGKRRRTVGSRILRAFGAGIGAGIEAGIGAGMVGLVLV